MYNKHLFYCSAEVRLSLFFYHLILCGIFSIFFIFSSLFFHFFFTFLLFYRKVYLCILSFFPCFSLFFLWFSIFTIKKLMLLSLFLTVFLKVQVFFQSSRRFFIVLHSSTFFLPVCCFLLTRSIY